LPDEIEVPTEHLHEAIHEAHHAEEHGHGQAMHKESFTLDVALSSAVLAVLAALAALYAGHHANEAMIDRVRASDQWSFFQAKGIKANLLSTKLDTLSALDKPLRPEDQAKLGDYAHDQKEISETAKGLEESSEDHLTHHNNLAQSVTFFQVAIALGAISVLTRKKMLWRASLLVGLGGIYFMGRGLLPNPPAAEASATAGEGSDKAAKKHHPAGQEKPPKAPPAELKAAEPAGSPAEPAGTPGEAPAH
jgi:hypothetical protein